VPGVLHRFDPPDRFVAGTVGEPGHRTFYLQARAGHRLCSVALEKEQVSVLADRLDALLDEIVMRTGGAADVPAVAPSGPADAAPLDVPIEEEFRVGTMTLAWDGPSRRIVIEAFAEAPEPDDAAEADETDAAADDDERDVLEVRISGAAARSFVARAKALVAAGRPPCPLCGQPLDPAGHICPRQNGYRRRG
jgi:uncharacterized repeat protein (TIGR03847 family)